MSETIRIEGEIYALVARDRVKDPRDSKLYKGAHSYVRVGPQEIIEKDILTHKEMEKAGFPIPKILVEGDLEGKRFFIEESLGENTFRILFTEDVAATGSISDVHFEQFLHITSLYLEAQAKTVRGADPMQFAEGLHVTELCNELPDHREAIQRKFDQVCKMLAIFPYVLSHGDLGPANMYPLGIIDLEDSFPAPFGFDAIGSLTTVEWYPTSTHYEFFSQYRFRPKQRQLYLEMCDTIAEKNRLPKLSQYLDAFDFCRGIWLCEGMQDWPLIQGWKFDRLISMYL